jgi:hypothetical protein
MKGSPGAAVKLLPCDHEVMRSSPGNSLLQKCRERQTLPQTLRKRDLPFIDIASLKFTRIQVLLDNINHIFMHSFLLSL